ncbi:MAG: response regulator [Elusimicrobia bacterium]|nr:response regulator [Elusimicrobiota bacterium]
MPEQKKILVIDDDITLQEFYTQVLSAHVVKFCTSGEDAVAWLEAGAKFDLIFLDLDLLGMSGFMVLERFKEIRTEDFPPVIVNSCLTDDETQKRALDNGAVAFMYKPIGMDNLLGLTQRFLGVPQ